MKVPQIKNSAPIKYVKSLYYANRPMPKYRGYSTLHSPMQQKFSFITWLKNLFK